MADDMTPPAGADEGTPTGRVGDGPRPLGGLLAAGDREGAYARVVAETQDSLYRFLLHMLRDPEATREVFQDTYLRVFKALPGFRGEAASPPGC